MLDTSKMCLSTLLYFVIISLLSLIFVFPWNLDRPFCTKGEPREAITAKAMLASGNWILPERLEGELPTKPPFFHWLIALSSVFSDGTVTEFTARLPSAILASSVLISVFFWTLIRFSSLFTAFLSFFYLLLSLEWHRASVSSRIDMTLSAFLFFGLLSAYESYNSRSSAYPCCSIFFFSLAVLTKGPVAIALPGIALGLFYFTESVTIRNALLYLAKTFIPAFCVCLIYYIFAYMEGGEQFLRIAFEENIGRALGNMGETGKVPHAHGLLYLYSMLFLGFLPWSLFIFIALLVYIFSVYISNKEECLGLIVNKPKNLLCRLCRKSIDTIKKSLVSFFSEESLIKFSSIIVCIFVAFFSIVKSKRGVYLLPAYPFISIIFAYYSSFAFLKLSSHDSNKANEIFIMAAKWLAYFCKSFVVLVAFVLLAILVISSNSCFNLLKTLPIIKSVLHTSIGHYLHLVVYSVHTLSVWQFIIISLPLYSTILVYVLPKLLTRIDKSLIEIFGGVLTYAICLFSLDSVLFSAISYKLSSKVLIEEVKKLNLNRDELYYYGIEPYGISYYLGSFLKEFSGAVVVNDNLKIISRISLKKDIESLLGDGFVTQEQFTADSSEENFSKLVVFNIIRH